MGESSIFWTTGTSGDGTNPYTEAQLFAWLRRTFSTGVLRTHGYELFVTAGAGKVSVNTGGAYVYGIPYENDASLDVSIPTPSANTRVDRIVLRAVWADHTVRVARLAGTEGAGPSDVTQNPGATYELPLARVSVTTAGAITVTDERTFSVGRIVANTDNIANGAITADKIAGGAVGANMLADGACLLEIQDDDGAGSGLDADLLDGKHAADFVGASVMDDMQTSTSIQTASQTTVSGGTFADISGMSRSVSISGACDLFIYASIAFGSGGYGTLTVRPIVDSTGMDEYGIYVANVGDVSSLHWYFGNLGAGSHTIKLQGKTNISGGVTLYNRRLSVIVIPRS